MVSSVGGSKLKSPIRFLLPCSPRERSSLRPPKKYQEQQDCLYPEVEADVFDFGIKQLFHDFRFHFITRPFMHCLERNSLEATVMDRVTRS